MQPRLALLSATIVMAIAANKVPGVRAWFNTKFDVGRHERPVEKIREIEREELAQNAKA